MAILKNLLGQKFSRLTVIERDFSKKYVCWKCQCDCGNITFSTSGHLLSGFKQSCGCLKREIMIARNKTHGMAHYAEYKTWCLIKDRCLNKNNKQYKDYGLRGIQMYEPWITDFKSFYDHIGPKPSNKHSADRIDNNLGYFPNNIRWSTSVEQNNNKRSNVNITYLGRSMTASQWAEETGINAKTILKRIKANWPTDELFLPTDLSRPRHINKLN